MANNFMQSKSTQEDIANLNLELIINDEQWNVIIVHDNNPDSYYAVDANRKTLFVHGVSLETAKYNTWQTYHS